MTDTCRRCEKILELVGDLAIPAASDTTVDDFIQAKARIAPGFITSGSWLYSQYLAWCDLNGRRPLGRNKFGMSLGDRGFELYRGTGGQRMRRGISVS